MTQTGGIVSSTTIYVRFSPTSSGFHRGNIVLLSSGAIEKNVLISGTGIGSSSYCVAGSTLQNEYIGGFQTGSFGISSGLGTGGYQDITSSNVILPIGINSLLELSLGNYKNTDQILIWVDWNNDGDFIDAGENVYSTTGNLPNQYITAHIAPPANAVVGKTRMRIRLHDTADGSNTTPCGNSSWGEVEDFSVNVTAASTQQIITVSKSSLSFGEVNINMVSNNGFIISGSNLTGDIVLTAPSGFTISKSLDSGYGSNSLTISSSDETRIFVFFRPTSAGVKYGNIIISSIGVETKTVSVNGIGITDSSPTLLFSTIASSDFGNVMVNTTSSVQSFTVSGSNLTANISLSAPAGFEISKSSDSGFGSTLSLTQSGGTVSNITVYVRFSPTSAGSISGNISITSTDAETKNVAVSGTGTAEPPPSITISAASLPDFGSVLVNSTSSAQSFTVSGSNLKANVSLSAPAGFEISKSSSSGYGSSLSLTQSGGIVSNTTIYVRFSPIIEGAKSGNVSISSTGAETKNVGVSGTGTIHPQLQFLPIHYPILVVFK